MSLTISRGQSVEESLRQQEALVEEAQRIGRMGSWSLDVPSGRVVWPEATCHLFGITPAEFAGTVEHVRSFIISEDVPAFDVPYARIAGGEPFVEAEFRIRRADGALRCMSARGRAQVDPAGNLVGLLGMVMDITEERAAHEQLAEQAALLRIAGRVARLGGWTIQLPDRTLTWSDENCAIHDVPAGYSPTFEEGLGYYPAEYRAEVLRHVDACARDGTSYDFELPKLTATGRSIWVRSIGEAVRDATGRIVGLQGAIQDITERKQLEQQYQRARRMESIGTLAGGIAHDLNNVLTPILLSTRLLQAQEQNAMRLDTLSTIDECARRGADLVSRVLSFASGTEGRRVEVQPEPLVREVVKVLTETFADTIRIDHRIDREVWLLQADPAQLTQMLTNLLENAHDAMPAGGRITIAARNVLLDKEAALDLGARVGPFVQIDVTDTGTGIPKEIIDQIFDPFFTTRELGQGTGLGLATALAIVKSHQGFIRASSEPGAGTRISVYLPGQPAAVPRQVAAPEPGSAMGQGETVLVVDDEALIRRIAKRTLEEWGYRVLLAADGSEAVAIYLAHQADIAVVLTDLMMPVMDGRATIQELVRLNPAVRIIGASGLAADDDVVEVAGLSYPVVAKPYSAATLRTALRAALA